MEECKRIFLSLFERWGYSPFLPSGLQLLETSWERLPSPFRQKLITVNSPYGEPCCLRGDITLATVAYLASHHAPEERPLRICYSDRVYMRAEKPRLAMESFQIGAELLGWERQGADVEMLFLLLETLDRIGLEKSVLVLGDATFLSTAVSSVESSAAERIISALQKGSLVEYRRLLEEEDIPDFYRAILQRIPDLHGGPEVLAEAEALWGKGAPLQSLKNIVSTLGALGYGERVAIDLSLIRELGYYSGPVFDVYSESFGQSLGGGGRYDRLLSLCGLQGQAMGFGLDLQRIASLSRFRKRRSPVMAWFANLSSEEALRRARSLASDGMNIEMSWCADRASSLRSAAKRGCSSWADLSTGAFSEISPAPAAAGLPEKEKPSC
jgi:ATP phosphoribosyltransferase regulatory subunit